MARDRLRLTKGARIALLVLWGLLGLFVLADLSESARGDSYLTRAIPWDLLVGAILTLIILAIDRLVRWHRSFAKLS